MLISASITLCALVTGAALVHAHVDLEGPDDGRTTSGDAARFADPVRVTAGDAFLGAKRMYPSPAVFDWNGDGRLDVVIGDLPGRVTFALRAEDGALAKEEQAKTRDGELLDFQNW